MAKNRLPQLMATQLTAMALKAMTAGTLKGPMTLLEFIEWVEKTAKHNLTTAQAKMISESAGLPITDSRVSNSDTLAKLAGDVHVVLSGLVSMVYPGGSTDKTPIGESMNKIAKIRDGRKVETATDGQTTLGF